MQTEFEPVTENAALKQAVVARIRSEGPVPFHDFMEAALYHPRHGYYRSRREKIGREGDYLTSPEVSPIFGVILGRQLREMWEAMDRPARFDVVEAGAGTGTLALDVLNWARAHAPDFGDAMAYVIVETSEALVQRQRELLAEEATSVRWSGELPEAVHGCILSNELLDSLPVHKVQVRDGRLLEVYVGWDGSRFVEELRPPSTPELESYFRVLDLLPGEGCQAEVNLAAPGWLRWAAGALQTGFVVTLDYGYEGQDLYAPWRTDGTLLCFYRHNPNADPYARLGRQDITSHVDFTTLRRAGEGAGLRTLGLVSQAEFLANLGVMEALTPPGEGDTNLEEYYARRRAVSELIDPSGLGRVRVLVQAKDVGTPRLTGLGGQDG